MFGSATVKRVQYPFDILSNNRTQKRILSANEFLGERILIFGLCLSDNPKWVSRIGTLLEANFGSPTTHFGFGCPYRSPIENSLRGRLTGLRERLRLRLLPEPCQTGDGKNGSAAEACQSRSPFSIAQAEPQNQAPRGSSFLGA